MKHTCPVCGFRMEDPPTDYNICPCCGTEHGSIDLQHERLRAEWIRFGAQWWSPVDEPPHGWNPWRQMIEAGLISSPACQAGNAHTELAPKPLSYSFEKVDINTVAA